jgi:hypothetical protein
LVEPKYGDLLADEIILGSRDFRCIGFVTDPVKDFFIVTSDDGDALLVTLDFRIAPPYEMKIRKSKPKLHFVIVRLNF